jgi:hypothetical protein
MDGGLLKVGGIKISFFFRSLVHIGWARRTVSLFHCKYILEYE